MSNKNEMAYKYLINHLCDNKDTTHLTQLMNAILTEKEQQELANRLLIFAMLQKGRPQREISEKLKVGIATVSRGAKAYQHYDVDKLLPNLNRDLAVFSAK